jgi:hypothetical protein
MKKMKRKTLLMGFLKKNTHTLFLGQRKLDEVYESALASSRTSS